MAVHHTKGGINGRAIVVEFMRDKGQGLVVVMRIAFRKLQLYDCIKEG